MIFTGGTIPCDNAADSNDDGTLNIADAIALLGYLFNGATPPPPPATQVKRATRYVDQNKVSIGVCGSEAMHCSGSWGNNCDLDACDVASFSVFNKSRYFAGGVNCQIMNFPRDQFEVDLQRKVERVGVSERHRQNASLENLKGPTVGRWFAR